MVRTARRYGTHVCDSDEWNLLDPDVIGWHEPDSPMARKIFVEATDFRLLIEPHAAALAALHANDSQRDLVQAAAEVLEQQTSINDNALAADFAFHATVLDASGSLMLRQFRGFLHAVMGFSYSTGTITIHTERVEPNGHSKVATALSMVMVNWLGNKCTPCAPSMWA